MDLLRKMASLADALRMLAAEPDVQLAVLPDGVCKADEIALNFGDAFLLVPELDDSGWLPAAVKPVLEEIRALLIRMSTGGAALWSDAAVRERAEWAELREHAKAALAAMGETPRRPTLDGITYVCDDGGFDDPT